MKFIFKNYKTDKKYGTLIVDIENQKLIDILKLYIKDNQEFLLEREYNTSAYGKIITRCFKRQFDKSIGSSLLRKIYNTYHFGSPEQIKYQKKREKVANAMGHSINTANNHYIKHI